MLVVYLLVLSCVGLYFFSLVQAFVEWGYTRDDDVRGAPYDWRKAPSKHKHTRTYVLLEPFVFPWSLFNAHDSHLSLSPHPSLRWKQGVLPGAAADDRGDGGEGWGACGTDCSQHGQHVHPVLPQSPAPGLEGPLHQVFRGPGSPLGRCGQDIAGYNLRWDKKTPAHSPIADYAIFNKLHQKIK